MFRRLARVLVASGWFMTKHRRHIAPVVHMLVRQNHQLRLTRERLSESRRDVAVARAQQMNSAKELLDANARVRRLEEQLKFIVDCSFVDFEADHG